MFKEIKGREWERDREREREREKINIDIRPSYQHDRQGNLIFVFKKNDNTLFCNRSHTYIICSTQTMRSNSY
jgi:hypothetical protein